MRRRPRLTSENSITEKKQLGVSDLAFGQLSGKHLDNPNARGRLTIFPPT